MTYLEKQTDPTAPLHWEGNMQADYFYSAGVAGDKFFKTLIKKGKFLASPCPRCEMVLFPARMYCEDCFVEIPEDDWVEVAPKGWVRLWTYVMINAHGEKMEEPRLMALIDIEDTDGSILGELKIEDMEEDLFGLEVKAKLRPKKQREGTMKDILYFEEA